MKAASEFVVEHIMIVIVSLFEQKYLVCRCLETFSERHVIFSSTMGFRGWV